MKFITFIIAVLILVLSVMPCTDANAMNSKAKTELNQTSHQQGNPLSDTCSPFCLCSCCTGFPIIHHVATIHIAQLMANAATRSFLPSEIIEIILPVWQPPRLV
ncbi:MAG TPA: DUF6660 family protein [Hanamia sp.]